MPFVIPLLVGYAVGTCHSCRSNICCCCPRACLCRRF